MPLLRKSCPLEPSTATTNDAPSSPDDQPNGQACEDGAVGFTEKQRSYGDRVRASQALPSERWGQSHRRRARFPIVASPALLIGLLLAADSRRAPKRVGLVPRGSRTASYGDEFSGPRPSPARRRNSCLRIPAVLHAHVPALSSARRELGAAVAACPWGPGCRLAAGLACRAQTASVDQRPIVAS